MVVQFNQKEVAKMTLKEFADRCAPLLKNKDAKAVFLANGGKIKE